LSAAPFILAAKIVLEISGRLFVFMEYIAPFPQGRVNLAERARLIFDIRPGITPVRPKARADVSSDFVEGDGIGVELCLF
jgi:hypothetical protein